MLTSSILPPLPLLCPHCAGFSPISASSAATSQFVSEASSETFLLPGFGYRNRLRPPAPAVSAEPPLLPYRRCRRTSGASRPPGSSSASSSISTPLSSPVDSLLSPSLPPSLPSFLSIHLPLLFQVRRSVRPSNRPQISFLFLLQSSPSLSSVVAVAATVATATAAAQSQLTNKSDDVVVDVPKNIPLKRNPHPARLRGPNAANGGAGAAQEGT